MADELLMTDRRDTPDPPGDPDGPLTLVVHGHFYQPPREDPRTGSVPVEAGASPWHDFNAKIAAECYHPNLRARVVDPVGKIVDLVDNYAHVSFNVGPTLMSWLEDNAIETYEGLQKSARASGNAIAQGFNHVILPRCNPRDLRTQIRWGLADFRHRFGRDAEGMWLPETAVNDSVMVALAEEGVRFIILAPHQVDATRPLGDDGGGWVAADESSLDTSVLYRWQHPTQSERSVTIVFYDGPLSNEVAFGIGSLSSAGFVDRVQQRGAASGRKGRLLTIATDGETFGHHHHFADRTLAFALSRVAPDRGIRVLSSAEVVRTHTINWEAKVRESAWSCAHGIERWTADCGCSTGGGPGWHQRWRAPLREALDLLRDLAASVFERRGAGVLRDPWEARDDYVEPCIGARSFEDFAAEHLVDPNDPLALDVARALLESQRLAMAMYTSCGWFFNDIAGIEARIVLRFAAGLILELQRIDEALPTEAFVATLARAEGNTGANGDAVWRDVLAEVAADAPHPPVPPGGWAPILTDLERAQEAVFAGLRKGDPIDDDMLGAIGRALGLAVP